HVQLDDGRIGEDHDSVPRRPAKSPTRPSDEGGGGFSRRRSIRRRTIPKSAEIEKISSLRFRARHKNNVLWASTGINCRGRPVAKRALPGWLRDHRLPREPATR